MVGSAGAYQGSGLVVGDVIVVEKEMYPELGVLTSQGNSVFTGKMAEFVAAGKNPTLNNYPVRANLVRQFLAVGRLFRHSLSGTMLTVNGVSGDDVIAGKRAAQYHALAENMEGAAAAHACALYGKEFMEVRGISNRAGERDKRFWKLDEAAIIAQKVVLKAHAEGIW